MPDNYGKLYVVATPIGNLADLTYRAVQILQQVDLIAAEDTRHLQPLLQHYGIVNKLFALHQHNEAKASVDLVEKLRQGLSIALVSDAGTPLLSDPGLPLVKLAREQGIEVSPIPGACAVIAALSVSGLGLLPFRFEGFLPRTSSARQQFFTERQSLPMTWAFYESCHRIAATLQDMAQILPAERQIVIAREMTKIHETIVKDRLDNLLALVIQEPNMQRGEFVVIVEAATITIKPDQLTIEELKLLKILLSECSVKTASQLAAQITGTKKQLFYQTALELMAHKIE